MARPDPLASRSPGSEVCAPANPTCRQVQAGQKQPLEAVESRCLCVVEHRDSRHAGAGGMAIGLSSWTREVLPVEPGAEEM